MARFAIVTWAGGGNLPPLLAVAELLSERSHDVHVLATEQVQREAESRGLRVSTYSTSAGPPANIVFEAHFDALTTAAASATLAREIRELVAGADLAIVDCMLPAAIAGARAASTGVCSLVHFPYGLARERILRGDGWTTNLRVLEKTFRTLELAPPRQAIDAWETVDLLLVTAPRWFDLPLNFPPHVVHAGPLRIRHRDSALEEQPQVLIAFSTTAIHGQDETLGRVLGAAASTGLRTAFTTGPAVDPPALPELPNVVVHRYADHDALMQSCAVVVTHGGLGTILRAVAHGVPLVVLPLGRDQSYNAERVTELGAGVRLDPASGSHAIRAAIEHVLDEPGYREAARRLARRIARDRPDKIACDALEACVAA